MTNFQQLTQKKFLTLNALLNYLMTSGIVFKVDSDTKDRIYAINPDTKRSYTFLIKDDESGNLILEKV